MHRWSSGAVFRVGVLSVGVLGISVLSAACGDKRPPQPAPRVSATPLSAGSASATTTDAALSATASTVRHDPVGPPHAATAVVRVLRGKRDAVVVMLDSKEGPRSILVLDGPTDRIAHRLGWDVAWLDDETLLYAAERDLTRADRLGVSVPDAFRYESKGTERFAQLIALALPTGRDRAFPVACGKRLGRVKETPVTVLPTDATFRLVEERWSPVPEQERESALAATIASPQTKPVGWSVATRDGRLRVVRHDRKHFRAERIQPSPRVR